MELRVAQASRRRRLFWDVCCILMERPPEAAHRHGVMLAALRRGAGEVAAQDLKTEIERMLLS